MAVTVSPRALMYEYDSRIPRCCPKMRIPMDAMRTNDAIALLEYHILEKPGILRITPRASAKGKEIPHRKVATIGAPIHDIMPS